MKLQDLTEKQVVQTTKENHESFMKLLDKEGFKWWTGKSYLSDIESNKYKEGKCFRVKIGTYGSEGFYKYLNYEIIPASKFLKPSKKELLERIERLENHLLDARYYSGNIRPEHTNTYKVPIEQTKPTEGIFVDIDKFNIDTKTFGIPIVHKPTEPKVGDLCAFAHKESDFDSTDLIIRELKQIAESYELKYIDQFGLGWKYARKVEVKFI